jgi:hypothetical protein
LDHALAGKLADLSVAEDHVGSLYGADAEKTNLKIFAPLLSLSGHALD